MTIHSSSDHVPKCLQIDMNSNIHRGTTKLKRRDIDTIPKIHSICSAFLCSLITLTWHPRTNISQPHLCHILNTYTPPPSHTLDRNLRILVIITWRSFSNWLPMSDNSCLNANGNNIIVISRLDRQAAGTANNYNLVHSIEIYRISGASSIRNRHSIWWFISTRDLYLGGLNCHLVYIKM